MSNPSHNAHAFARPSFTALPSSSSIGSSSYSSTASSHESSTPASAPLPSPSNSTSHSQPNLGFFGSLNQQQQQQPQVAPQNDQGNSAAQHTSLPNHENTSAETDGYLSQMALLAEAAKRAQMAVVMRDMDEMEL
jgi:hypothetical protein